MDFTYKITTQDYANYLNSYNSHMKIKKNIDKFIKIFLIIACIILVPYFSFQGDMLSGAMFLVGIILVYIMYLYFPTDKQYEKQLINASIKHFKEYPETGNVQQIKLLEDGVIHYSNGLKKKVIFNNIKKAYLTNGTIVAIDTNNTLSFIIPTHVFDSEEKRDKFISLLNKC